jgi:LPS-assembly lipoprotein
MVLSLSLCLCLCLGLGLIACGFHLKGQASQPTFQTLYVQGSSEAGVLGSLRRLLGSQGVQVKTQIPLTALSSASEQAVSPASATPALILLITHENFERAIVGTTPAGGIRDIKLQIDLTFSVRTTDGHELIAPTRLNKQTPMTYNETVALSKEDEQAQLTRMMRDDIAGILIRRMTTVTSIKR